MKQHRPAGRKRDQMSLTNAEFNGIREGLAKLAIDCGDHAAAKAAAIWHYTSGLPETAADYVAQYIASGVAYWLQCDVEATTAHRCAEATRWARILARANAWDENQTRVDCMAAGRVARALVKGQPLPLETAEG